MNISVIIPTFNRVHTLARTLDSVMEQVCQAAEVIVVDDGSDDDTQALIKSYVGVKALKLARNHGVSYARNAGMHVAQGPWLALLDSDDAWLPDKLARQVEAANKEPDMRIFHTDEIWIRNGKRVNPMNKHAKPDGRAYEASLALCCVSPSSVLFHHSVLKTCGDFDESLPACEDYDLWLRLFSRYPVRLIKEPLVIKYGGHDDQLSRQYWGMDRFRVKALCKMLDSGALDAPYRVLTLDMLQRKCLILIKGAKKRGQLVALAEYQSILAQYTAGADAA